MASTLRGVVEPGDEVLVVDDDLAFTDQQRDLGGAYIRDVGDERSFGVADVRWLPSGSGRRDSRRHTGGGSSHPGYRQEPSARRVLHVTSSFRVRRELNTQPRQCLGFKTPSEVTEVAGQPKCCNGRLNAQLESRPTTPTPLLPIPSPGLGPE